MVQSKLLLSAAFIVAIVFSSTNGVAQDYPTQTIHMVTHTTAGSGTDAFARIFADGLSAELGQNVIVEPKGGAGGLIGIRFVAQAKPDGYTVGFFTSTIITNLYETKEPGYKIEDFIVLGSVGQAYLGMLINNIKVPAKNLQEFIAYAKANPGKLNYGAQGGSIIMGKRLIKATGINVVGVGYKGGAEASKALLSGEIQFYFNSLSQLKERLQFEQITALAMSGENRVASYPNLPTFKELGYPTITNPYWYAVVAPLGMPQSILQRLQNAVAKVRDSQKLRDYMKKVEIDPSTRTPEQFTDFLKDELKKAAEDYK